MKLYKTVHDNPNPSTIYMFKAFLNPIFCQ